MKEFYEKWETTIILALFWYLIVVLFIYEVYDVAIFSSWIFTLSIHSKASLQPIRDVYRWISVYTFISLLYVGFMLIYFNSPLISVWWRVLSVMPVACGVYWFTTKRVYPILNKENLE